MSIYIIDNNGRFLHKDKKICQVEMYKNNNDMTPFFFLILARS